jgi:dsDNA-specific endonuclease/ATPase MutS2
MSHRPVKSETTMAPIRKIESREVDLHIEKLRSDFGELSAGQILDIQLSAFEKEFDRAIRDMVNTLVIIHGVGAGVLKEEIHKRLSKSKQIKHYKEGRKEKFGYGATEIQF